MIYKLGKNELETILKSALTKIETTQKESLWDNSGKKAKLIMDKVVDFVVKEFNVISYNNKIYFKDNERYISNTMFLLNRIYNKGLKLTKSQDSELMHQLEKKVSNEPLETLNDNIPIVFNNGYQLQNGSVDYATGEFSPFALNVAYNPKAYDEHVDNFLNWFVSDDKEMRQLIEEILGHIIMVKDFPQHSFFFVGSSGKNGKSTFFEMISNFCGDLSENLALEEMYKIENLSVLRDKLVNCGDDIDNTHILSSRTFKNLVGGNKLMVRELYSSPKPFKNKATMLFSCNEMPNFKDKSGGIGRRVRIIPCNNTVTKMDLSIDSKLSTDNAKSYLLNLALKGLKRIINNGGIMIEPKESLICTEEYIKESNTVTLFLEYCIDENIKLEQSTSTIYMLYQTFCESEGQKPYSKSKLSRELKKLGFDIEFKSINNKTQRYYVRSNEY